MEHLKLILEIIGTYWSISLISYVLAWIGTEVLPPIHNVKPFNCRACLSFWNTFLMGVIVAFFITPDTAGRLGLSVLSVLCGLGNYLYIKKKFKVYE